MATGFSGLVWNKLVCSSKELRLDITLKCGQSFRWKVVQEGGEDLYLGVLQDQLLVLKQDQEAVHYTSPQGSVSEALIKDYFNLGVDLETLYIQWSKVDPIFLKISESFPGVRILRQDPVENLFSFICSANNNIQRIAGMVENMSKEYGVKVCEFEGTSHFSFPSIQSLAQPGVEEKLRTLGFGYRAKYIEESARRILALGGPPWLHSLRSMEYKEAKENLLTLSGVGPKVADCILLMSMDQPSAVPVDTHVFQIAKQYLPHLHSTKSVTTKIYAEIGDHFRGLYGGYAGWAHSVLFSADLRHLQNLKQTDKQTDKEAKKKEVKQTNKKPVKEKICKEANKKSKKQISNKTNQLKAKKTKKKLMLKASLGKSKSGKSGSMSKAGKLS